MFAVLIAAHNAERFILDTLESVRHQTLTPREVVVVDDGSTDSTADVVSAWCERHNPLPFAVRLLTIENSGQSVALTRGLEAVTARWVALLDADDVWHSDKLSEVAKALQESDTQPGMIVHPLELADESGTPLGVLRPLRARLTSGDARQTVRENLRSVAPPTSGVCLSASVFRSILPMATAGLPSAADAYLTLAATLVAPVLAIDRPLGLYRVRADGMFAARLTTAQGLSRQVEIQRRLGHAFGHEVPERRNSFFARNAYAERRANASVLKAVPSLVRLLRSLLADQSFRRRDRIALSAFWLGTLMLPRRAFMHAWRMFQRRQMGL